MPTIKDNINSEPCTQTIVAGKTSNCLEELLPICSLSHSLCRLQVERTHFPPAKGSLHWNGHPTLSLTKTRSQTIVSLGWSFLHYFISVRSFPFIVTRLGIFVVKVRENLLISSSALPGPGRGSGKNNNPFTDFNYANPKPDCDTVWTKENCHNKRMSQQSMILQ